jgi:hypothetical protein
MRSQEEICRILLEDLERAMQRFHRASEEFQKIIQDVPSGLAHPDGSFRVQQAGSAKRAAVRDLSRTLRRHNNFILNNKIPEDLLE